MNGIVRNVLCPSKLKNLIYQTSINITASVQSSRFIWHMSNRLGKKNVVNSSIQLLKPVDLYSCNSEYFRHTKAEKDLIEFLADEITAEKRSQKLETIPTEVDGFAVSLDGANVKLVKQRENETVTIAFNVNHTVDTDSEAELDPSEDKPEFGEMKSKPNFTIDIRRGGQTLGFSCSFTNDSEPSQGSENYSDCFGIDEITIYQGEHNDKVYAVAGEVIDGYLYDLLMNYLEEKGISYEFAEKLIDLSTSYEHSAYISLLEGLSKFTSEK